VGPEGAALAAAGGLAAADLAVGAADQGVAAAAANGGCPEGAPAAPCLDRHRSEHDRCWPSPARDLDAASPRRVRAIGRRLTESATSNKTERHPPHEWDRRAPSARATWISPGL
jgi:hypothetical protein